MRFKKYFFFFFFFLLINIPLVASAETYQGKFEKQLLEGKTISTTEHEWFLVKNGELHRISDWPTALSWGLLIEDRLAIPLSRTEEFYTALPLGKPLDFSEGKYSKEINALWKGRSNNFSKLPTRLIQEIKKLTIDSKQGNAFLVKDYIPQGEDDAYAKLLNWDWMWGNPSNFTIAFIGDQGINSKAKAVLTLIKNEGADMVLHQGDFDYTDNPAAWDKQISDILGPSFPYFASIGNHDVPAWNEYKQKLENRLKKIPEAKCEGEIGVNAACTYHGIFFILSGVGTYGSNQESFLEDQLAKSNEQWKICSWHKNQKLMQVGDKQDEVGWDAYEICRKAGAIIATGHDHAYARTYLMSDFDQQKIASTQNTLEVKSGKSFAFVSGLGGHSIHNQVDELIQNPWWASVYQKNKGANYGALFCSFNKDSISNTASCYFKDINGNIPDQFNIITPQLKKVPALIRYGHRGYAVNSARATYPENTLLSVQKAIAAGSEGIEIDVWTTKDLIPVLSHGTSLDKSKRNTNCKGFIHLSNFKDIKDCLVYSSSVSRLSVPLTLLEDIFKLKKPQLLILDLKNDQFNKKNLESIKVLADLIYKYHREKDVILMLYRFASVKYARSLGVLAGYKSDNPSDLVIKSGATHFFPWEARLSEQAVKKLKKLGIDTIPFIHHYDTTAKYAERITKLRCWGIIGLIQNLYFDIREIGREPIWCY